MSAPPPTPHCASAATAADSETAAHSDPQRAQTPGHSGVHAHAPHPLSIAAAADTYDPSDQRRSGAAGHNAPAAQPLPETMAAVIGMTAPTAIGGADAATSATADAPTPTAADTHPPSAADRLHRHALESVFALLHLSGLAAALRVSRDWKCAVASMRRLELTIQRSTSTSSLPLVSQSLLGRHVAAISWVAVSGADLVVLADRMAHLQDLYCKLSAVPPSDHGQLPPLRFPAQLRRLRVVLTDGDAAHVNTVIAAIAQLPLLEELRIWPHTMSSQFSFAPLAALPRLRSFGFQWLHGGAEFSDAQVDELRALPRLRQLHVHMKPTLLRRLLRQPHQLQWQEISLPFPFDDGSAALLPQLPSLTQISHLMACSRFEWLRGLPNLTDVCLSFLEEAAAGGRIDSLVAGLRHCNNIEVLKLQDCHDVTAAHLADLLPRLPRLRGLILASLRIDSLAFLSQPPLTNQLSSLELDHCHLLPVTELRHVHALRGLHTLQLVESFGAPLGSDDQSLLTPPSALLPQLAEFCYSAPIVHPMSYYFRPSHAQI